MSTLLKERSRTLPDAPETGACLQAPFSGRYINLDASTQRRARLEQQLHALGLAHAYARFAAVDGMRMSGAPGAISRREHGCFASHARLVREACSGSAHLHVLEDDALLSPEFLPVMRGAIDEGVLDEFDLLFTDVFVPWDPLQIASLEWARRRHICVDPDSGRESLTGASIFNLHGKRLACTSSYFVARRSLDRVAGLLESALAAGPAEPVDLTLRELVDKGTLKAACIVPFVTSVALEEATGSTIHGELLGPELSRLACSVVRHAYFVRPDWGAIESVLERYFPPQERTPRQRVVDRMMQFLIGNARPF
ncbi:MAG: glycosyltransferase family 25 protein [Steroidobacteraceae bacterium]